MTERNLNELLKNVVVPESGPELAQYAAKVMAAAKYNNRRCVNVACKFSLDCDAWDVSVAPVWNWQEWDYAIIPEPVTRVEPYRDAQAATFIGRTYRWKDDGCICTFTQAGTEWPFSGFSAKVFANECEWVTITEAPNGDAIITVDGPCGNVVEVAE